MKTLPENITVLIVEDNPSDSYLLEQMLLSSRLSIKHIFSVDRLSDALSLLNNETISLILLDLSLPDSMGIESFLQLKDASQKIPVIILTGMTDSDLAFDALQQGAQDYLVKGEYNVGLLIKSIEYSIGRKKSEERILYSVTEQIRLEKELSLQKQQTIDAVLIAQEKERKNLGEELHDNINQILTAIKISLGVALQDPLHTRELVFKSMKNASLAIEEIRKLSKVLILSGNLMKDGMIQSVRDLILDTMEVTGMQIILDANDLNEDLLNEEQKITLYRMIQEQLTNIIKHAEATSVTIDLCKSGDLISLSITDNGKGFDLKSSRNGIGMKNIISRAELFNGEVKIYSSPGNGCSLKVDLNTKVQLTKAS